MGKKVVTETRTFLCVEVPVDEYNELVSLKLAKERNGSYWVVPENYSGRRQFVVVGENETIKQLCSHITEISKSLDFYVKEYVQNRDNEKKRKWW